MATTDPLPQKVERFAREIETALMVENYGNHDHHFSPYTDLARRLRQRLIALEGVIFANSGEHAITFEAARVAALALMVADKAQLESIDDPLRDSFSGGNRANPRD